MKIRAFTLIELLIVIAIIGILASVIVISLSDSSDSADKAKAKYNVAQAARHVAIKIISTGQKTAPAVCPAGSTRPGGTTKGVLYCLSTAGGFVVYEKYRVNTGNDTWCMDEDSGAPKEIDMDTTAKSASGGC